MRDVNLRASASRDLVLMYVSPKLISCISLGLTCFTQGYAITPPAFRCISKIDWLGRVFLTPGPPPATADAAAAAAADPGAAATAICLDPMGFGLGGVATHCLHLAVCLCRGGMTLNASLALVPNVQCPVERRNGVASVLWCGQVSVERVK